MSDVLNIKRSEYIRILKNRGKHVSSRISDDALYKKVKYLKKQDLSHLATIRKLYFDDSDLESILYVFFSNIYKKNNKRN